MRKSHALADAGRAEPFARRQRPLDAPGVQPAPRAERRRRKSQRGGLVLDLTRTEIDAGVIRSDIRILLPSQEGPL